ncbi:MAG: hypothetical protein Q4E53_12920 [Eubacteriales bacterium]|nr:hypothetical protein [Eubacteriales bacterium]
MSFINYIELDTVFPFSKQYAYVDVSEHLADRLFIDDKIRVKFINDMMSKDYPYCIVFCKIRKRDKDLFMKSLEKLKDKVLLLGYTDYEEFCNGFLKQLIA